MVGLSFITHLSSLGSILTLTADNETEAQRFKITRTWAFFLFLRFFPVYYTASLSVGFLQKQTLSRDLSVRHLFRGDPGKGGALLVTHLAGGLQKVL